MKKTLVAVLMFSLLSPALALAGEWTGWITDTKCAAKGNNADHADCARKCHKEGAKLVFYNTKDEKLYTIDNQKLAAQHIGYEVKLTGEIKDKAIKVAAIEQVKEKHWYDSFHQ